MLAEILGPDLLVVVAIVLVLFGGSQLPKLARSLGSASHEFRRGLNEHIDDAGPPNADDGGPTPTR